MFWLQWSFDSLNPLVHTMCFCLHYLKCVEQLYMLSCHCVYNEYKYLFVIETKLNYIYYWAYMV